MSHHLGRSSGAAKPPKVSNQRNCKSAKTVLTDDGPIRKVSRNFSGNLQSLLIPKHERRFTGFDDKIVAMSARYDSEGNLGILLEQYGTEVSLDFNGSIADAVMAEATVQ